MTASSANHTGLAPLGSPAQASVAVSPHGAPKASVSASPTQVVTPDAAGGAIWAPVIVAALIALVGTLVSLAVGKLYVDGRLNRQTQLAVAKFKAEADSELENLRSSIAEVRARSQAEIDASVAARIAIQLEIEPLVFQVRQSATSGHDALERFLYDASRAMTEQARQLLLYDIFAPQAMLRRLLPKLGDQLLVASPEARRMAAADIAFRRFWRLSVSELALSSTPGDVEGHDHQLVSEADVEAFVACLGQGSGGIGLVAERGEYLALIHRPGDETSTRAAALVPLLPEWPPSDGASLVQLCTLSELLRWTSVGAPVDAFLGSAVGKPRTIQSHPEALGHAHILLRQLTDD